MIADGIRQLTQSRILWWAEEHIRRTGRRPTAHSGPVLDAPGETWGAIHTAMKKGSRGLPGGFSLTQLLDEHFPEAQAKPPIRSANVNRRADSARSQSNTASPKRGANSLEPLTPDQILKWADLHFDHTGRWPISRSGPLMFGVPRTWEGINTALRKGLCGLPGGSSLAQLLRQRRGARDSRLARPNLTVKQILEWADEEHLRTRRWPHRDDGQVRQAPDITWATIDNRLDKGGGHLPGGMTLTRLLREHRGVWDSRGKPRLTTKLILRWADNHYNRTGRWPNTQTGALLDMPDHNWIGIDMALRSGQRGLPGGSSLMALLQEHRPASGATTRPRRDTRRQRNPRIRAGVHV